MMKKVPVKILWTIAMLTAYIVIFPPQTADEWTGVGFLVLYIGIIVSVAMGLIHVLRRFR